MQHLENFVGCAINLESLALEITSNIEIAKILNVFRAEKVHLTGAFVVKIT